MKILTSFTHPHVIPKVTFFLLCDTKAIQNNIQNNIGAHSLSLYGQTLRHSSKYCQRMLISGSHLIEEAVEQSKVFRRVCSKDSSCCIVPYND